ncbi:hypothetical protein FHETE_116 [Fusarium heterosporum]|uniref:Uncharacterized protein n=1 Tax=Fusarium heterosporum TaxID=42747 RepID=A0A8H5TZ89_FUSHE|nr:hypothetical protein FHETE_116 [Fusarium heterosporum]
MQQPNPNREGSMGLFKVLKLFVAVFAIANFISLVLNALAACRYSEEINNSPIPFSFLAAISGIAWVISSLTLLFLFTKIRQFNHRVARYVFKIIAVIAFIFLIVFYFGWATSFTFQFPFTAGWGIGRAAIIFGHMSLLLAIFITLLSAVLDTPKDIPPEPPTGPNTRQASRA